MSGVLVAFAYGVARGCSSWLRRGDHTSDRIEQVINYVRLFLLFAGAGSALLIAFETRPGGWLLSTLGVWSPVGGVVADVLVAAALLELTVRAEDFGFRPIRGLIQGEGYSFPSRLGYLVRSARAATLVAIGLPIALSRAGVVSIGALALALWTLFCYVALMVAVAPVAAENSGRFVRNPTADERSRIEACCERFGLTPDRVVVYTNGDSAQRVYVDGYGDSDVVRVDESFLDVSDEDLTVALAQATGRTRNHVNLLLYGGIFGLLGLGVSALGGLIGLSIRIDGVLGGAGFFVRVGPALVAAPLYVACMWASRRAVYRADAFASDRLGAETVRDAYYRIGTDISWLAQDVEPEGSRYYVLIRQEPWLRDRLDRLDAPPRSDIPAGLEPDGDSDDGSGEDRHHGGPDGRPPETDRRVPDDVSVAEHREQSPGQHDRPDEQRQRGRPSGRQRGPSPGNERSPSADGRPDDASPASSDQREPSDGLDPRPANERPDRGRRARSDDSAGGGEARTPHAPPGNDARAPSGGEGADGPPHAPHRPPNRQGGPRNRTNDAPTQRNDSRTAEDGTRPQDSHRPAPGRQGPAPGQRTGPQGPDAEPGGATGRQSSRQPTGRSASQGRVGTGPQRQHGTGTQRQHDGGRTYWWVATTSQLLLLSTLLAAGVAVEALGQGQTLTATQAESLGETIAETFAYGALLAILIVPLGVYMERKHTPEWQWRPSPLYYAGAVPFAGALVAAVYLIQRYRYRQSENQHRAVGD